MRTRGRPLTTEFSKQLATRSVTSQTLADAMASSLSAVQSWRSGRCMPHPLMIAKLASHFGVTERTMTRWLKTKPSKT